MQDSTVNIISNLFSNIVNMCKNITVPGMNFSFFGLWVGVFLFAMLSAFLLAFFGFGGRFGASSLGGMYHDKVSASKKARAAQAAEDEKAAYVVRRTRESNEIKRRK